MKICRVGGLLLLRRIFWLRREWREVENGAGLEGQRDLMSAAGVQCRFS